MTNQYAKRKQTDQFNSEAIVEVKPSLLSARDLRDGLASLSMTLADELGKKGYLLLLDPELSDSFLETQLYRIKAALRPEVAERLHLVVAKRGEIKQGAETVSDEDKTLLYDALAKNQEHGTSLPLASKKDEVFLVMLHRWVTGQGPIASKSLEAIVGCNYRTVASTIERLGHVVQKQSDRSVSLKHFPEQEWGRFLAVAQKARATMRYADASDQPRSLESLLRRVRSLNRKDIAIGGVLGAKYYYNDLDIVGTPRLDLCIHCPDKRVDLEFVHALDPALEWTRDSHRPARLALHFVRRQDSLFDRGQEGSPWADSVECLLELYNAGLEQQARRFQEFLALQGKELSEEN